MRAVMRLVAVIASVGLIIYGIYGERHELSSFMSTETEEVNGLDFTKGATIDRFILHDGGLYDGHGLSPEPIKECPT